MVAAMTEADNVVNNKLVKDSLCLEHLAAKTEICVFSVETLSVIDLKL